MTEQLEYFIIDFSAKFQYQHNAPLINELSNLIRQNGNKVSIFLPKYADKYPFRNNQSTIKYLLFSPLFGPSFFQSPIFYLFFKLLIVLARFKYSDYIKASFRFFLTIKLVNYFENLSVDLEKKCVLVFPTADPLSIELARRIIKRISNRSFVFMFRITGVESRGIIASGNELDTLVNICNKHPNTIRLGVETPGYLEVLQTLKANNKNLYWAPWFPSYSKATKPVKKVPFITIGFLGAAKKRKGFDQIPEILECLEQGGINFRALIQRAVHSWQTYEATLFQLELLFKKKINFLPGNLEFNKLMNYLSMADILILPYDRTSYRINASGLLYHAADYEIPVIASSGTGFEKEILENRIGFVYDQISQIPEIITKLRPRDMKKYFNNYNKKRVNANMEFYFKNL